MILDNAICSAYQLYYMDLWHSTIVIVRTSIYDLNEMNGYAIAL